MSAGLGAGKNALIDAPGKIIESLGEASVHIARWAATGEPEARQAAIAVIDEAAGDLAVLRRLLAAPQQLELFDHTGGRT
jgi:hypothetical protein